MRRIDENTYIDDTLVTCAEYQLFIDEMREQGKYYQPDHWTSYQFPAGQARKPILGVRYQDASAFCEWVTKRDDEAWFYYLASKEETHAFPMEPIGISPLGHWGGTYAEFSWVGNLPIDARAFTHFTNLNIDVIKYFNLNRNNETALARAHANACSGPLDIVTDTNLFFSINLKHDLTLALERDRVLGGALNRDRDLILDRNLELALELFRNPDIELDLDSALQLYFDIFTLRERIAGRSPAFEGIRLVKERIR